MGRRNWEQMKEYVVYNDLDEVIAVGTKKQCARCLHKPPQSIMNFLAAPTRDYTVVVFLQGKYECTRRGIGYHQAIEFIVEGSDPLCWKYTKGDPSLLK